MVTHLSCYTLHAVPPTMAILIIEGNFKKPLG